MKSGKGEGHIRIFKGEIAEHTRQHMYSLYRQKDLVKVLEMYIQAEHRMHQDVRFISFSNLDSIKQQVKSRSAMIAMQITLINRICL
jgi:hypothetical protein